MDVNFNEMRVRVAMDALKLSSLTPSDWRISLKPSPF